ncbi:hypothetical protein N3K66_000374 [Trichothecium roseum]|uniref:Uncharacterized protein n=1 Tax=Trichothecium roseum TaxID=47278 RepID=A0ACC0VDR1_9HYPO|nr:hypothetical protein N3K66_000374 [Trichothecium roseum]
MPSQRPFFLSSFIAAFRQQPTINQPQPNKHATPSSAATTSATATAAAAAAAAASASSSSSAASASTPPSSPQNTASAPRSIAAAGASHNHAAQGNAGGSVGHAAYPSRRRGSDSSSEGFRDVIGADKWYIGGRTPGGEEKFFKLGVVKRVRSNDGLSLDRLSL